MLFRFVTKKFSSLYGAILAALVFLFGLVAVGFEARASSEGSVDKLELPEQVQRGADDVVIEGLSTQSKLKDLPVPAKKGVNLEAHLLDGVSNPFALLLDVEKLTGIPETGFDLFFDAPVVILTPPKGSNR